MTYKKDGFDGQRAIILPKAIINKICVTDPVINSCYITDLGYYPKAKFHYRKRPQGSDQNILIYCVEGTGKVTIADTSYNVSPGEFFIIPSHVVHQYKSDEKLPWTIYWCHFKGERSDALVQAMIAKTSSYLSKIAFIDERIQTFDQLYVNLEKGYSKENLMYVNLLFMQYLTSFLFGDRFSATRKDDDDDFLERSVGFMQTHLDKALTLADLAGHLSYSASHFSYRFKHKTGFSPIEYFNHLKIQKSCQYLQFTPLRIKEVAAKLGIDDPFYFTRLFKSTMGSSPKAYRDSFEAMK